MNLSKGQNVLAGFHRSLINVPPFLFFDWFNGIPIPNTTNHFDQKTYVMTNQTKPVNVSVAAQSNYVCRLLRFGFGNNLNVRPLEAFLLPVSLASG